MTRHRLAPPLIAAALMLGCTSTQKNKAPATSDTNQAEANADKEAAPEAAPPAAPISGARRACAVAAAAPEAPPSQEDVDAIKADLEAMLRPHEDEEERFERLQMNWNVDEDLSGVLVMKARVSTGGVMVHGVARELDQVAEFLMRLKTRPWNPGGVWLSTAREARADETDAYAFTIFAGRYPHVANPHAALDPSACGPDAVATPIDDATVTDVDVHDWGEGAFPPPGEPEAAISTLPPRPRPARVDLNDLESLRGALREHLDVLAAIEVLHAAQGDGALEACAAGAAKGAAGFEFTRDTIQLLGVTDAPTCEGVTVSKEGGGLVLRAAPSEPTPAPTRRDVDAMGKPELLAQLEKTKRALLIARERLPSAPESAWLLMRLTNQMRTAGARVSSVDARSWSQEEDVTRVRFEFGASGPPEAVLEGLSFVARMTRIVAVRAATFDAAAGAPAAIELEAYFYAPR